MSWLLGRSSPADINRLSSLTSFHWPRGGHPAELDGYTSVKWRCRRELSSIASCPTFSLRQGLGLGTFTQEIY